MIGFYNYTVILTYVSLISSFIGIAQLFNGQYLIAIFCLLISGFCDMFDGVVARKHKNRTEQEKVFGIQIDSLCDLVCFGVFPALFNYTYTRSVNEKLSIVSLAIGVVFTLTALIRLGYFNVMEQERQKETAERREYYQGLPVTSIAGYLPFVFMFRNCLDEYFVYVLNAFTILIAFLFVYNFKMKKPHGMSLLYMTIAGISMVVILILQFLNIISF